jgi:hypothetical protein
MECALLVSRSMTASSGARSRRARATGGRIRCVVAERGSAGLEQTGGDFDETIVVAQLQDEPPSSFEQRVLTRVAGIERSGRHCESITMLTGNRHDLASTVARRRMVFGLARHGQARGELAELQLAAQPQAGPASRAELLGLIGEVLASAEGKSPAVRLLFDQDLGRSVELDQGRRLLAAG